MKRSTLFLLLLSLTSASLLGTDILFFATADLEYSADSKKRNHRLVNAMNWFPGAHSWPKSSPYWMYSLQAPKGVIVAGGVTAHNESQSAREGLLAFADFEADFGLNSTEGLLNFPVYEGFGKQDYETLVSFFGQNEAKPPSRAVIKKMQARTVARPDLSNLSVGGHYSWDWEGVHFIQLNLKASDTQTADADPGLAEQQQLDPFRALSFLKDDLKTQVRSHTQPVVIIQHSSLSPEDPQESPWSQAEQEAFYEVLKPYNVIALLHGQKSPQSHYQWHGIDVFNVSSKPQNRPDLHAQKGHFTVFHITDHHLEAYPVEFGGNQRGSFLPQWGSNDRGLHFQKGL